MPLVARVGEARCASERGRQLVGWRSPEAGHARARVFRASPAQPTIARDLRTSVTTAHHNNMADDELAAIRSARKQQLQSQAGPSGGGGGGGEEQEQKQQAQ